MPFGQEVVKPATNSDCHFAHSPFHIRSQLLAGGSLSETIQKFMGSRFPLIKTRCGESSRNNPCPLKTYSELGGEGFEAPNTLGVRARAKARAKQKQEKEQEQEQKGSNSKSRCRRTRRSRSRSKSQRGSKSQSSSKSATPQKWQ